MLKKFIEWMKYNPPYYATAEEWVDFDKDFKKNAPIRYFFCKGKFRNAWWKIKNFFEDIIDWIKYRTISKYHIVDSGLSPNYYDIPELMLYTNFNLLVRYVEEELPALHSWNEREKIKNLFGWKYYLPWFIKKHLKYNKKYAIEYGMVHLDWEQTLTGEIDKQQAKVAKEIKELYLWWTEERPKRKLPEYPDIERENTHIFEVFSDKWRRENPEYAKAWKNYIEEANKLEEKWDEEDEEMLIRLTKVRQHLWT
jgi:hypothetical protein